jgi:hypothetical protein
VDVDPVSSGYGNIVGQVDMPQTKEVLQQFPSERFLRVAAALSEYGQHDLGAVGGLRTYA